eukprot:6481962-Amphidinium_carterae.1
MEEIEWKTDDTAIVDDKADSDDFQTAGSEVTLQDDVFSLIWNRPLSWPDIDAWSKTEARALDQEQMFFLHDSPDWEKEEFCYWLGQDKYSRFAEHRTWLTEETDTVSVVIPAWQCSLIPEHLAHQPADMVRLVEFTWTVTGPAPGGDVLDSPGATWAVKWPAPGDEVLDSPGATEEGKGMIVKELNIIDKEELKRYPKQASAARTEELTRWTTQKSFARIKISECSNLIDAKWVYKFKGVSTDEAQKLRGLRHDHPDRAAMVITDSNVRHLRARMVERGFKDMQWHGSGDMKHEAFSGTASRCSQRVILAMAAQHDLTILCLDVAQAFLKGC